MFLRLLFISILGLSLSGCATTAHRLETEQLQSRVTELEKKMEAKDSQIVDLQYQVKDLSGKAEASPSSSGSLNPPAQEVPEVPAEAIKPVKSSEKSSIIRVQASVEDVQTALKAAGVYTGTIDGKVGAATRSAIIEFQKSHGLKADGILGKKTWEELKTFLK